jgi:hypothetical protein
MNVPRQSTSPALETAPPTIQAGRKRCENCNSWMKLDGKNPANDKKRRFCKPTCKAEFNRYGSAYGPLKQKLEGLIASTAKIEAAIAIAPLLAKLMDTEEFRDAIVEKFFHATVFHTAMVREGFVTGDQVREQLATLSKNLKATIRRALVLPIGKRSRPRVQPRPRSKPAKRQTDRRR